LTDIFDEVSEDLRAERARALLVRYGGVLVALAVLVVAGAGAWQGWRWVEGRRNRAVAAQFFDGMRQADTPHGDAQAHAEAAAAFDKLAGTAGASYRTLARLREAALRADSGDQAGALGLWEAVGNDGAADRLLRDLATLLWVQHQLDGGDPAAVEAKLQPLLAPENAWHGLAQEADALLALRTGRTDAARDMFRRLAADASVPDGVRGRANAVLASLGG
jgi:hypothetical protein